MPALEIQDGFRNPSVDGHGEPPESNGFPAEILSVPAEITDAILHGVGHVLPGECEARNGWGTNAAWYG